MAGQPLNSCRARWTLPCVIWLLLSTINASSEQDAQRHPLTVADVVAMTKIIEPDLSQSSYLDTDLQFAFSPDRQRFVIVTERGDLDRNKSVTELLLFHSDTVLDFINRDKTAGLGLPAYDVRARFSHASNHKGIAQIKWSTEGNSLYFLGINQNIVTKDWQGPRTRQLYHLNIDSKKITRLTQHPRPVTNYDIDPKGRRIIFSSTTPFYSDGFQKSHYIIGTKHLLEISQIDRPLEYKASSQYYIQNIGEDQARPLGRAFPYNTLVGPGLWISPNGRWAIAMLMPQQNRLDWAQHYLPIKQLQNYAEFDSNTMSPQSAVFWQFALINLEQETLTPIIDAPNGQFFGGGSAEALWLPDSESVILANTFLPLDSPDPEENNRRRQSPATIEYRLKDKTRHHILEHTIPEGAFSASQWFAGIQWMDSGLLRITERPLAKNATGQSALSFKWYQKKRQQWRTVIHSEQADRKTLQLSIHQDLMTPPDILAHDPASGREKIITQLNPQFKDLLFGHVEVYQWTDKDKQPWMGGLVYPPDYQPGQRYPLMIQTHGFDPHEFLIEGPAANQGAYAAQALANKGIVVLQMQDREVGYPARFTNQLGIEALIDQLDKDGIIDRQKVGLMGFSATGHIVQHMLVFSDYSFATATIADGFSISFMAYVTAFGSPQPGGMPNGENMHRSQPWGEGLQDWVASNPVFHLDRVKTPLRLEFYTPGSGIYAWWDIYSILRRQQKPVEAIVLADGVHNLIRPNERFLIQQGNVDWAVFWLKGEEDKAPEKAAQYQRWRKLRKQQLSSLKAAITTRADQNR